MYHADAYWKVWYLMTESYETIIFSKCKFILIGMYHVDTHWNVWKSLMTENYETIIFSLSIVLNSGGKPCVSCTFRVLRFLQDTIKLRFLSRSTYSVERTVCRSHFNSDIIWHYKLGHHLRKFLFSQQKIKYIIVILSVKKM